MSNTFRNYYNGKTVLVTGHTGFKGSWLSIWLNMLGAKVIGYSLEPTTNPSMYGISNLNEKITGIIGDIRDYDKLFQTINKYKPEIVFHLAAQAIVRESYIFPKETYETNIIGTINLMEAVRNTDCVKSIIVVTSDKCYENREADYSYSESDPMGGYDPYSSSKGCVELIVASYRKSYLEALGIGIATARAGNVIGGGDWAKDRLIPDFIRAGLLNNSTVIRNPHAIRPWQHVLEPLSGYLWLGVLLSIDKHTFEGPWNIGPDDNACITVENVLKQCIAIWKKGTIEIENLSQPHEAKLLKLNNSKAKSIMKWYPIYNIDEALLETMDWYEYFYVHNGINIYEFTQNQIDKYERKARNKNILWSEIDEH